MPYAYAFHISTTISPPDRCFIGRGDDLYRISSALRKFKIVVVHGTPGIGKSSTASVFMNFAARRCMYPGGSYLVSCKGALSDDVIWENLAVALKISVSTGIHDTKGQSSCSNRQLVISRVANKKILLVRLRVRALPAAAHSRTTLIREPRFQVLDCVENVPPDTLLGVWKELSAASEQLRLLMTTRSLFATQDLEDFATTVEIRRLSRRASVDLLRNIVKVSHFIARTCIFQHAFRDVFAAFCSASN